MIKFLIPIVLLNSCYHGFSQEEYNRNLKTIMDFEWLTILKEIVPSDCLPYEEKLPTEECEKTMTFAKQLYQAKYRVIQMQLQQESDNQHFRRKPKTCFYNGFTIICR